MMRSVESASSVFYYSQEEDSLKTGGETLGPHRDVLAGPPCDHEGMADGSPASRDAEAPGRLVSSDRCCSRRPAGHHLHE